MESGQYGVSTMKDQAPRRPRSRRGERGQTSTEYLLTLSVMVIGMIAATSAFYDPLGPFHRSMRQLSRNVVTVIAEPPPGSAGPLNR